MDVELKLSDKAVDDPMDLANGEDIPETFPGAENLPPVSNSFSKIR